MLEAALQDLLKLRLSNTNMLRFKKSVRLLAMDGLMLRMNGCIRAVDLGEIPSFVDGHELEMRLRNAVLSLDSTP